MPLVRKDAAEFSVFIVIGKHNIGRCILSQSYKALNQTFSWGLCRHFPGDFPSYVAGARDIKFLATRASGVEVNR